VIVPWTELRPWSEVEKGEIEFAQDPGRGHWVHIEIVFVAAGTTSRLVLDEMHLLGSLTLVDGGEVKVIARKVRPTPEEAGRFAVAREEGIAHTMQSPQMIAELSNPKANVPLGVHGNQADGTRFCVDLALKQPPPGHAVICTGRPVIVGAP
jgi:hypothetical protein